MSVVVVAWNALSELQGCLESIVRRSARRTFEIVVVDNGSHLRLLRWVKGFAAQHECVRIVRLEDNTGFARGVNLGVSASRGRFIVLLNSDTAVTKGWLDGLIDALEHDRSLGIVSPTTNYVGEGPQLDSAASGVEPSTADAYAATIHDRDVIVVSERLTFFCVAIRRELFEMLNGLDEGFGVGNFEDDDFCSRAELLGFTLAVAGNVFVYHEGSATFRDNAVDHGAWMTQNAMRRLDKLSRLSTGRQSVLALRPSSRGQPVISVVMRTYDRPHTLRLALASLANQTFEGFDVVLVNSGGSVDDVIADFEPRLRINLVSPGTKVGLGEALNAGLERASAPYVAYLDDDDIVYPFHLSSLLNVANSFDSESKFVYSHFNYAFIGKRDGGGVVVARHRTAPWAYSRDELLVQNRPPLHTWLHSSSIVEQLGGFDSTLSVLEDWDFLLRATERVELTLHPRETCEYRVSLNFKNAMSRRSVALEAMKMIYARHPVASFSRESERTAEIAELEKQVALVDAVSERRATSQVSDNAATRELVRILFGLELPTGALLDD